MENLNRFFVFSFFLSLRLNRLCELSASSIYRQSREIDNERVNNPTSTTKHSPRNLSNIRNERVNNSFHNILSNGSAGHSGHIINNNGFNHDDDKFTISSDAHSLPIVAPAEPKSKSKFSF